jgi:hypothetical protein
MVTITSASTPSPAEARDIQSGALQEIRMFWRDFIVAAFNPYRPELHYMRGPGPAWRAKHGRRSHSH